jgi:formamidopyrimidine-DNA glycosylase
MEGRAILNLEKFVEITSKSKIVVKPLIMDQTRIGGIGNIYANDGLFLAKIDPRRRANTLTLPETKKLYKSVITVMEEHEIWGASELNSCKCIRQEGNIKIIL